MKQSQQLCSIHKKEINGMCVEGTCKYQTRLLCPECQFTHQKCQKKVPLNKINSELEYILNTDAHQGNCSYFLKHSAIQIQIDENMNKLKEKIKSEWLELELKNLQNILLKQSDSNGAQILLDLKNNLSNTLKNDNKNTNKLNQRQLSRAEYETAAILYREKQHFDRDATKSVQSLFNCCSNEFMNSIFQESLKLKDIHYDATKIYQKAEQSAQKMNTEMPLQNIVEQLQNSRFRVLEQGHNQYQGIVSIIDCNTHLVSGSDDGLIIGWHKPSYNIDFRIKSNDGLNCLGIVKVLGQNYLFVGGQGQIQTYSMHTQQKLYALNGHRLEINKMMGYSTKDLISCSKDGTIKIWDIPERQIIQSFNVHEGPVSDFIIIDKELISVGQDGIINFIDLTNQAITKQLNQKIPIYSIGMIKQNKIVIALGNGSIRIIKGNKKQDIQVSDELIWKVLPLNRKMVACLSQDGYLNIIDLKRKKRVYRHHFPNDTLWQDIALVDKQLIIPKQGKLEIYNSFI